MRATASRTPSSYRPAESARPEYLDFDRTHGIDRTYGLCQGDVHRRVQRELGSTEENQVSFFQDDTEVYKYLGGVFTVANGVDGVGNTLRAADIVLRLDYTNPSSS